MGIEELEYAAPGLEYLMPQREINGEDGKTYRVYLEEEVVGTDRCFAYSKPEEPSNIFLFQLTSQSGNSYLMKEELKTINIEDDPTAKNLLNHALKIYEETKTKTGEKDLSMKDFAKTIAVGRTNFTIAYQPPTAGSVNIREQYEKRVLRRIQREQ